jgi:hypothetical protein
MSCLSNIIEMSNVVFLLSSGLSRFNSSLYRIKAIFSRSVRGCPLSFFEKASFQILLVNFSTQTVMLRFSIINKVTTTVATNISISLILALS